ncbi:MAG: hypothetical protein K9G67_12095 [Bacteroidales bacterium]|nr:hypothetical protein [Bacteroidales bacterium]MCF8351380.1 hypothetical protein [Bacteroidales bacterium]MCF8377089.1 hypothetical protein [Bacteroidales bacterium]MCF8402159.1 hypothetical protein [Bacteroidales bacterium]
MKPKLFSLVILLTMGLTDSVCAQQNESDDLLQHELSIGAGNLFMKDNFFMYEDFYSIAQSEYLIEYLDRQQNLPYVVFGYRYHLSEKMALRSHFNFFYSKHHNENNAYDFKYKSIGSILQLGLEWSIRYKSLRIFYGFDAFWDHEFYKFNKDPLGVGNNQVYESKYNKSGYGLMPLFGADIHITQRISIGTQASLFFEIYQAQENIEYTTGVMPNLYFQSEEYKSDGIKLGFGPIGLVFLNVHL